MSCLALIGGGIGFGKSTLITFIEENKNALCASNEVYAALNKVVCRIIIDELCPIEEQAEMMKSLKGWKCFRADLLMSAEHFISSLLDSNFIMHGPLTERSLLLLEKLKDINKNYAKEDNFLFLLEDNFYYRSMRYEWFQLSRRVNVGFCEIFLDCPLDVAISRNAGRGYSIPEDKIRRMLALMEYPEPEKYKWEKFSMTLNSSGKLQNESLKPIISLFEEASKNPAEMLIMSDKIQSQSICSKNVVHQADKVLRKSVSKTMFSKRDQFSEESLVQFTSFVIGIRHTVLSLIKNGEMELSRSILESLKSHGIEEVQEEFEKAVSEKFDEVLNEKLFACETLFQSTDKEPHILWTLKASNLDCSPKNTF